MHDSAHVLLGYGTTVSEEIAVKWFEMQQTGLPLCSLSAFVGPMHLLLNNREELARLQQVYLPHVIRNARATFILNIYFEKEFATPIAELQRRTGIVPFKL